MMRQTTGPVERVSSLIQLLRVRAATQPDDRAFTFLGDGEVEESWVTFQQLDARARRLAGWLQSEGACGERVLLLYPSGLEFIAAFFGCLYAGAVAVPAYPPRRNRAMPQVRAILADARAKIALTTSSLLPDIEGRLTSEPELATVRWQATDTIEASCAVAWREPDVSDNTLAFLQYTSGSTGMPKGVMVSHGNLIQNEEMIGHAFQTTRRSIGVSWLPLYHDMGLIGLVLHPLYIGAHSILMSPVSFLQRPIRWLKAISDYRATISGGPNFAYELCTEKIAPGQCAGLDLSCWEVAFSGAEPVKAEALERFASAFAPCGFRRKAFYPCYGMAEATLIITGGLKDEQPVLRTFSGRSLTRRRVVEGNGDRLHHRTLVGCGTARPGQRLVIVDPDRLTRCGDNEVGEIWVSGPNVAQGYWNRAEETKRVFDAHLAGNGDGGYLRTGDLGFVAEGELYVTGRLKNLIIIRGRNYYPHDIEVTVEQSHPALRTGNGAAFSVEIDGEERLVVCQEVERGAIRNLPVDEVFGAIQAAVAEHHDLQLEAVLLLKTSSIPKTSSGKIKHHACRMGFLDGSLEVVAQWRRSAGADAPVIPGELVPRNDEPAGNPATVTERPAAPGCAVTAKAIQQWLVAKLAERLKVPESEIDVAQPFARYGLDSVAAVGLANALEERLQRPVPPTIAYDYPTVELLARHLAEDSRVTHETFARQGAAGARSATLVEPIAVVGLGCRFPGATGPDAFWALMRDGRDAITPVPSDRWDVDRYFDANPSTPEKMNTRWGGFLDQVDRFDATFFGISRPEAENMDPQQRLLLEVSWEALEHAGIAPHRLAGTQSGVFVGISSGDYARLQFDQPGGANVFAGTGNAASIAANRVSYVLDLRGPSWTVDTACSSSLVAVHQACRSLRQQECDLAIAGGVNVILSPELTVSFSQAGFMASDGRCKAFDAAADGYVRGEGCGVVVLKRLSDALRDRDPIRAVIAGSAVNQDGRSNGLTAPNGPSQQAVVRSALDNAGVTPAEISYIEAHGTGTSLGDPIEVNSLKTVLMEGRAADQRCFIGSVKTNIGHLEAAAGIAGLIKVVLAMERGEIPPHLHLKRLNPNIAIDNTPLSIPAQRTAWPAAARRLAGVSSFGFGGTNAHVIVAQPPALEPAECSQERTRHLLTVSARSDAARRELARRYAAELEAHPETSPGDFCHTANTGRSHGAYRWAAVAGSTEQLRDQLAAFAAGSEPASCATGTVRSHEPPRVALLFTGQGSQYAGMGRQLFQTQPTFRAVLEQCHELLKPYLDRPLLSLLFPQSDGDALLLDQTKYAQPALFALEYALASLWGSWGIEPTLVMGHSVGEYAAACFAGVFGLEDGLRLIAERGARMQELPGDGAMVAVMAGEQRVLDAIGPFADDVAVAALNGPAQVVISGRAAALDRLVAELSRQGIPSKKLRVSHAFHSPLVDPMLDKFEHFCRRIRFRQPQRRLVSNVTGAPVNGEVCRPEYWRRHTRQPVRFAQSMAALRDAGCEVFLEVGPRPTLLGMGRACLPESDKYVWAASLRPQHDDWEQILSSLAAMYAHGVDCDWQELDRGFARRKLALPTYPFQRQRYWREMPADRPERSRSAGDPPAIHPLLGTRLPLAGKEVVYESRIGMFEPAFLADHRLGELAFVPVSAYLAIALAAARDARRESDLAVAGLAVERPLTLPENGTREIQVVLTPEGPADYSLVVAARDDDSDDDQPTWQRCVSARLVARERTEQPAPIDLAAILERCTQSVAPEDLYRRYRQWGVDYGPAFQVVERLWRGEGEGEGKAVGLIRLPQQLAEESSTYPIHPVMLDACVQVLGATLEQFDPDPRTTWLPAHVERFELVGRAGLTCYVEVTRRAPVDSDSTAIMADAIVIGAEGELVCRLDGLRLERVRRGVLSRSDQSPNDCLYQPQWRPQLRPGPQLAPEHQPAPGAVIERLRPTVAPVVVDVLLSNYDQLMDELEDLSVDFIVRAFHQLGWTPAIHDQFTTAAVIERLNVVAAHGRLVGRLLEILAEEGMLCREGDLWQVARLRDAGDPCQRVADLRGRHAEGDAHLILLERCASQLAGVLRGEVEPLDLLFPNGDTTTLSALYQDSPGARVMNDLVREAVAAVVDRLPDGRGVRLLEIGAGTGGTTAHLLPAMPAGRSEYVFTDVSAAFTTKAEEQFAAWPFLRTKVLDIEKSPTSQGFEAGSYDIVVAANVMHATRDLRESLTHARQLLAPGGLLVLLEGTAPQRWMDLTFGLTAGWWRFTDSERRPSYPLVSAFCWEDLFAECGFAESAAMSPDIERGRVRARQSVMVAQASVSHERRAGSAQAPDSPTGPWLILADRRGTGEALADLLRRHGGRCIRAFAGTEFARISEDFFTISSGAGEDYRRLLVESGGGEARALAGVVHLWNLDAAAADQLDLETLESAARVGCGSVLHLVRALAGAELAGPPRLWLVTSRAQAVADGERVDGLAQSALWGLGRALALEHPELSPVRVDVDVDLDADLDADLDLAGSGAARVASLLFDEMSASTGEDQIAFRGGARHVARLARVVPAAADGHSRPPESIRFSPDVSYLITGGTGGLGRVVARWMVERGARHLVLVGRGEPNEHCSSEFGAMRDSGAQLLVLQADVASRHDVAGVLTRIEESLPRLAGIIHAAGVSEDGYLSQMAWEDFARAVSAKVRGAWNLHDLTLDAPLDFFVLFSSAAALLGSPGGGSYGAGNAFLDALAHRRRALGLPGASVNWGPWTGIGMATDAKSQAGWNAHGMRTISVAASLEVLSRAIDDGPTQVATLAVDWSKLLKKTTVPPFLADFAALPPRQTVPRRSEFVKQLESVPASERRALLVAHVRDQIVNVLSIDPAEPIDLERGFFDLGLDSLTLVELRNRLQSSLSMSLPATLAFDYPTPSALVEHLAVHVPAMNAADASGKSESARAVVDAKSAEPDAAQPVAIVGMSCRMPGGATLESFWQMLRDGGDATSEVPADRWDVDSLYDPDPNAPGKICCRRGAFLPQVDQFDPDFFGISPRETLSLDPQQRLLLETAWEALENAGQASDRLSGSLTGVFVGIYGNDYAQIMAAGNRADIDAYVCSGNAHSVATGRLSYLLGLQGPSMAVDTACSSSLVAAHLACQSLRNGECDMALAGGVSLILAPERSINLSRSHMLSPDGRCKTFDAAADGFARGEGAGVIVLKRLSDALADGDRVLAVILGSAVNQDGASGGLTVPNGPAQQTVIRKALAQAGVEPRDVDYVEAHGTGTELGDPIELGALGAVFGGDRPKDQPLLVGSVKTNIGHLEAAAGVAGLIKVVLALQHAEIPPHLHFQNPNPHFQWDEVPLRVASDRTAWTGRSRRRTAGVSSFGFGGTNAHVVIQEAPAVAQPATPIRRPVHVLTLSAKTADALDRLAADYCSYIGDHPEASLQDICHTANTGRSHFAHRLAVFGDCREQVAARLAGMAIGARPAGLIRGQVRSGTRPRVAFLFSGQGSQYAGMGAELYRSQPVFRRTIQECDEILRPLLPQSLLSAIYPEPGQSTPLDETAFSQPAIFALECALAELWKSWGIEPSVVLGHSVGEYAAARVAGVFSLEDGLKLIARRARLMQALPRDGRMVAVMASESVVAEALEPYAGELAIAAINGPRQIVVSGRSEAMDLVAAQWRADGIRVTDLVVSHAFHSPLMEPMLDEFRRAAGEVSYAAPRLRMISNVTGAYADEEIASANYWVRHVRAPVRFAQSIGLLGDHQCDIFLELGPGTTLLAMGRESLRDAGEFTWLPSLRPRAGDWHQMLESLGQLYASGAAVRWDGVDSGTTCGKLALPTYPFQRKRYWVERRHEENRTADDVPVGHDAGPLLRMLRDGRTEELARQLSCRNALNAEESKLLPKLLGLLAGQLAGGAVRHVRAEWLFEMQWRPQPRLDDLALPTAAGNGRWLIFADGGGVGESLRRLLEDRGDTCVLVYPGSNGTVSDPRIRHMETASAEEHERLVQNVLAEDPRPLRGVVHLWSLDSPSAGGLDAQSLRQARDFGCCSALHVLQPLIRLAGAPCPKLWLVTRNAASAGQRGTPLAIHQSTMWGFGKVVALEHPEAWGGMIDLGADAYRGEAQQLLVELTRPDGEDHIAFRTEQRLVARLVPSDAHGGRAVPLDPAATYLITGGLGALGLHVAGDLVERGARHLVLVGRSGAASPDQQLAVEQLRQRQAEVLVMEGDVADAGDVARLLQAVDRSLPPLRGVFHVAGVLDDGVLLQQSRQRLERVMAAKVFGAWNLHVLTASMPLDFFVCFSSAASVFGSPGQANYAAANAFLDALAWYRRDMGLASLTVNWGPWRDAGMAADAARRGPTRWATAGVDPLDPADGLHVLNTLLSLDRTQVGVFPVQWSNWRPGAARDLPILRDVLQAARQNAPAPAGQALELVERLKAASEEQRPQLLRAELCREVAAVLGLPQAELADTDRGFAELGFDSLMALELRERLQNALGCPLSSTLAFNYPNIDSLVDYLNREILFAEPVKMSATCAAATQQPAMEAELDEVRRLGDDALISEIAEKYRAHD